MAVEVLLELQHVSKTFGATLALTDASLVVQAGEVHGLLGTNGSGKSTMLKILSGFVRPDDGAELTVRGEPAPLPDDGGSYRRYGWGFVHQDLALFPGLRVVDNFHLSGPLSSPGGAISWRREMRTATAIMERFHLRIDPATKVADLPTPKRALLAIARAMHEAEVHHPEGDGRLVLFLDESTVSLEAHDRQELSAVIDRLIQRGCAIVLVSHDLGEVRQLTHRVTVLRDGRVVGAAPTADVTDPELLTLVVGEALSTAMATDVRESITARHEQPTMRVRGLGSPAVDDVAFDCYPGEILGLTGLVGSGYEEVPYLLFGARPEQSPVGSVDIRGRTLPIAKLNPSTAIANGICLVPGSRATQGAVASVPIWQNVTLPSLGRYENRFGKLGQRREREAAAEVTRKVAMTPPDVAAPLAALSGGNQQKVVVAKWLNARPSVLLLHEPTVGIDVGARSQVHALLRAAAREGMAVVCVSGDYEQLEALCQRVLVFRHGRIHSELLGSQVSKRAMAIQSLDESDG